MKPFGKAGLLAGAVLVATASFAFAHDPAKKSVGIHGMECGEHHSAAMKASDEVSMHLTEARRSNTLAAMRTHVEAADKAMTEMKTQMSMCTEMMDKTRGSVMENEKGMMGGGGMMSGKTSTPATAEKVVDPVCGMEVDTANAPKVTHAGKTYYFCSEEDKAKFLKNPEQYLPKKS